MTLSDAATAILIQLSDLIERIEPSDFVRQSEVLSGSTVGQHVRHTLEFFTCLREGCLTGVVNYDKRAHDPSIETDRACASDLLARVVIFVEDLKHDAPLLLEVAYDTIEQEYRRMPTNTFRELVYNIEHAVHHMAMIKMALREVAPYVALPQEFGIAASTLRNRRSAPAVELANDFSANELSQENCQE